MDTVKTGLRGSLIRVIVFATMIKFSGQESILIYAAALNSRTNIISRIKMKTLQNIVGPIESYTHDQSLD